MDRAKLTAGQLVPIRIVEQLISKLFVRCMHSSFDPDEVREPAKKRVRAEEGSTGSPAVGCQWQGKLSEEKVHLRDDCMYAEVLCTHAGCLERVIRRNLEEHCASCAFRAVTCQHYEAKMPIRDVQSHLEVCDNVALSCAAGCGAMVLRCDIDKHRAECPLERVGGSGLAFREMVCVQLSRCRSPVHLSRMGVQ